MDEISCQEIFDIIKNIQDPEHPLTLESLKVCTTDMVEVDNEANLVTVYYNPTVPQCTLTTVIGLSIRTALERALPARFHISVLVQPGTHEQEHELNKQVNDKERAVGAMTNPNLASIVDKCLSDAF
eukprot:TRINITY_DN6091_c0_g1_i1.p1 TRINITY_DN6091_c0_g1~~TRINITY_DN6091_c0_g1_i1.p1  ORF type:complete len:143 (+),score=9.05 TRINITY_DN6091_c0_g1_i1:49-429(+)